jgi:hypothetical protein
MRGLLAVLGLLAMTAVVLGGQPPAERADTSPVRWPIADVHALPDTLRRLGPVIAWVGAVVLVLAWLIVLRWAMHGLLSSRSIAWLAGIWAVPLALGPPVLSADVYSYLAQGELVRRGLDPYRVGVSALGSAPIVAAVDERWRAVPSPYGPLGLAASRLAAEVGSGSIVAGVVLLRVVAVAGVVLAVYCCVRLTAEPRRPMVLALVALNPIVLLHLIGGAHLDALMVGLVVAGLLLAARGRPYAGLVVATAAASVKAPALIAVAVLLVCAVLPTGRAARLEAVGRAVGVTALTALACAALVPDGVGWLRALSTPGRGRTESAPTSLLAGLLSRLFGLPPAGTLTVCRLLGLGIAGAIVVALLATARRRDPMVTAGLGQLAAAVLGPVTYVWYLAGPIACCAPRSRGRGRAALVALSAAASLTSLPSLSTPAFPWPPAATASISGNSRQAAIPGTAMPESLSSPPRIAATPAANRPSTNPGTAATARRCGRQPPRAIATARVTANGSSRLKGLVTTEWAADSR